MKWTQLADLPAPLFDAYITVQCHKVYVIGSSPDASAKHQVYVYDINTDQWDQLPPSAHYYGIPHIIGGKLVIIGGRLSATKKMTNKISTFDEDSQTWTSYYPDLLLVRSKPGVVSHLEHVIVAGGAFEDDKVPEMLAIDDIEVLNWVENLCWRKVPIKLPVPMCLFTPTITNDGHMLIVGYGLTDLKRYGHAYKISAVNIIASCDQQHNSDMPIEWTKLTSADHTCTALVCNTSPPVIVGGEDNDTSTADIKMYTDSNKSWQTIGSLSSARSYVAIAAVYNNAIIVIGGCSKADSVANIESSSLTIVELGQAELFQ